MSKLSIPRKQRFELVSLTSCCSSRDYYRRMGFHRPNGKLQGCGHLRLVSRVDQSLCGLKATLQEVLHMFKLNHNSFLGKGAFDSQTPQSSQHFVSLTLPPGESPQTHMEKTHLVAFGPPARSMVAQLHTTLLDLGHFVPWTNENLVGRCLSLLLFSW